MLRKIILLLLVSAFLFDSCSKDEQLPSKLETLCGLAPDGWRCEITLSDFDRGDIPMNAPEPYAILKYFNDSSEFETFGGSTVHPSLTLDFYPIKNKKTLLEFVRSQQMYSWCIPIYYGETDDFLVLSSPCFINGGSFTDEANQEIQDLHDALGNFIENKEEK